MLAIARTATPQCQRVANNPYGINLIVVLRKVSSQLGFVHYCVLLKDYENTMHFWLILLRETT